MKYAAMLISIGVALAGCDSKPAPVPTPAPIPAPAPKDDHDHKHDEKAADSNKAADPVCKMTIAKGALKAEFDNADIYFCSQTCADKFKADPKKYVKPCTCAAGGMKNCGCEHCSGKREPCDCN